MINKSHTGIRPIHFFETTLQIIEENKINYPRFLFCLMIVIFYSQDLGYIFDTYEFKSLYDPKIIFFAHWNEISPPDFILYMNGIDQLTFAVICIMHSILWFYVIYITTLTIIRIHYPRFLSNFSLVFKFINTFYVLFFSSFLWVLYTPFTEVHAGLLVIGDNAFLVEDRDKTDYSQKSTVYLVMGSLGVSLTFVIGCILSYCYISYDFYDKNLLKRSLKHIQILQLLSRSLLVTLYYLNMGNVVLIKHVFAHILGITGLYDYFELIPFRDEFICNFYGCATCIYEYTMILFSFWELTEILPEYNLFFLWVVPSSFLVFFMICFYKWKKLKILTIHPKDLENNRHKSRLDLFLETIYELSILGESDKVKKIKLLGFMSQFFKVPIKGLKLFELEKFKKILTNHQEIDKTQIIKFLNELFQVFLNDKDIRNNQGLYETVMMKYCTFLSNFQNNPIKAYYELKKLLMISQNENNKDDNHKIKQSSHSIIFSVVSKLISDLIEKKIAENFMLKHKISLDTKSQQYYQHEENHLNLAFLPRINEITALSIIDFINLLKVKIDFYEKLIRGYNNLNEVQTKGFYFIKLKNTLKNQLNYRISQILDDNIKENIIILRLHSLFSRLILNDHISSNQFEKKLNEISKKHSFLLDVSSLTSFLQLKTIVLSITLLQKGGIIINKKTHKMANFFGYQLNEFQIIKSIDNLMPCSMASAHQDMIDKFIKKGPEDVFVKDRQVYALNKRNYIFPINLKLTLSFIYDDDYCLSGFLTKIHGSTMDMIFTIEGDIIGMTEGFLKEMGCLMDIDIKEVYMYFNCFLFMPDLLDDIPTEENIDKYVNNKELVVDLVQNKIIPCYFVSNMQRIMNFVKTSKIKNEKKFIRRFINSSGYKVFVNKKLVQFSLRLEIIPGKSKNFLKLYFLQIKQVYHENTLEYLNLSYSLGRSTIVSSGTMMSADSKKTDNENITEIKPIVADSHLSQTSETQSDKKKAYLTNKMNSDKISNLKKILQNSDDSDNNSDCFEKNDDQDKFIEKEKSEGLTKKKIGENLVKDIIEQKKTNKILKKILILSVLQVLFFFSVNFMCEILINQKIEDFKGKIKNIENNMLFISTFYKMAYISNLFILQQDNVFMNEFDENLTKNDILYNLIEDSYTKLRSLQSETLLNGIDNIIDIKINYINIENIENFTISTVPLIILTWVYQILNKISPNINIFLVNLHNFMNIFSQAISYNINDIDTSKTSFSMFYVVLTVICFIIGFLLQLISFTLIRKYSKYLEKILLIVTRLQEKECEIEVFKLKTSLKKLESPDEIYLIYDFDEVDDVKLTNESTKDTLTNKKKLNKSYNVNYLSNKIINNNLNNRASSLFFLISIIIVSLYYAIIFIYMKKIQETLDNSVNLIKYTQTYYICLNKMDLFRMVILSHNQENNSFLSTTEDILYYITDLNDCVSVLQSNNNDLLPSVLENSLGNLFSSYNDLLNQDLCSKSNISQLICDSYNLNSLKFGIQGYSSYIFNKISQYPDLSENSSVNAIKTNLFLEGTLNKTILSYNILMESLDDFINETNNIEDSLMNIISSEIIWLFFIGGLGCSFVLLIINVFRYKLMRNDIIWTKEMLRLIPISKLLDESTIQMLKNLDN